VQQNRRSSCAAHQSSTPRVFGIGSFRRDLEEEVTQDARTRVAKGLTSHEVREMTERLPENHVAMFSNALLQLLLQVPASMLILAHTSNLSLKIFQASTSKPIN
jgi:transcriptional accessory protein Tex/SPT6